MIEAHYNDEWVEANVPQADIGDVTDYFQIVKNLKSRENALRNNIFTASENLAPTSGSTPSLKKVYDGSSYSTQGGCTDGTYIYFYIKASDESNAGTFVKMKRSDYSVVSTKSLGLYHGNDMCYNPDTGLIYVSTMYRSGDSSRIDVIDPVTLTRVSQKYVPFYISAIAYEPMRKAFVGASGSLTKQIFKLNESNEFEPVRMLTVSNSPSYSAGRSSQGITCDSAFIYHSWSSAPNMYIEIFDYLGNYIRTISKSVSRNGISMEIEFIEKTSKNGLLLGMYGAGQGGGMAYIYTMTLS